MQHLLQAYGNLNISHFGAFLAVLGRNKRAENCRKSAIGTPLWRATYPIPSNSSDLGASETVSMETYRNYHT